jgi:hypothetical protein
VRRAAVDAVRDSRGGGLRGQGDALVAYGDALVA